MYGPKQDSSDEGGVVAIFIKRLLKGLPPIIYGNGTQVRSFTYVKDTVGATLFIAQMTESVGRIYNIASGIKVSIKTLVNTIENLLGVDIEPVYEDWRPGDIRLFDVDNSALRNAGYGIQYTFEEGLQQTIEWFKNFLSR